MDGDDAEQALGGGMRIIASAREPHGLRAAYSAEGGPTPGQWMVVELCLAAVLACAMLAPCMLWALVHRVLWMVFGLGALWRWACLGLGSSPSAPALLADHDLPSYSVIVPLKGEANMVSTLVERLDAISYPRDRLQVILALEVDDTPTRLAVASETLPASFEILLVSPRNAPPTKPRACNAALVRAWGERVVIYDAEDRPDPLQLREAAARFARDDPRLACLQAPLRIEPRREFFSRQFALEYAALFEVALPASAVLGLPFPLGGTSNHFKTNILREVGGWDAWNVTEDADLGFRLTSAGHRSGVILRPTFEHAPIDWGEWLPQRARWLKGYMQTWGVHMRRPVRGGAVRLLALQATLGVSILSAMLHGPVLLWLAASLIGPLLQQQGAGLHWDDAGLLILAWSAAIASLAVGGRRAGTAVRVRDLALAPFYWLLLSVAFLRAVQELCTRPHHWAKTPHHTPEELAQASGAALDEAAAMVVSRAG